MISKEKKAAIMKEYGRSEGDTGSRSTDCYLNSSYCRINRAFKRKPQRSSFKTWSS